MANFTIKTDGSIDDFNNAIKEMDMGNLLGQQIVLMSSVALLEFLIESKMDLNVAVSCLNGMHMQSQLLKAELESRSVVH